MAITDLDIYIEIYTVKRTDFKTKVKLTGSSMCTGFFQCARVTPLCVVLMRDELGCDKRKYESI